MRVSYDRRMAKQRTWDASVLGITADDYERMDEEEREQYLVDSLFRAVHLLDATVAAFHDQLESGDRSDIKSAVSKVYALVRKR